MKLRTILTALVGATVLVFCGCGKEEPEPSAYKPREAPKLEPVAPAAPGPVVATPRPAVSPTSTQPAATAPAEPQAENDDLQFTPPAGWKEQPPRAMIHRLFVLPKAEGDISDAEVTVSFLGTKVALQMNINRWCGQFELPENTVCNDAAKQRPLPDTKNPTIIVELAGAYKGSMGAAAPPRPGYRMIAAQITTDTKPWYIKLIGPEKTVAHWEKDFLEFVRSAK